MKFEWGLCSICEDKTRLKMCEDTILKNYPLFCQKHRHETLISAEKMKVTVKEEDKENGIYP